MAIANKEAEKRKDDVDLAVQLQQQAAEVIFTMGDKKTVATSK
jgi:hypothetical protein